MPMTCSIHHFQKVRSHTNSLVQVTQVSPGAEERAEVANSLGATNTYEYKLCACILLLQILWVATSSQERVVTGETPYILG